MERKAITVSIVAFLGLATLQAVAGVESSDAVASAIDSNVESLFEPSKNLIKLNRNPEADRRNRGNKRGRQIKKGRNENQKEKQGKNPMRQTKKGKHSRRKARNMGKNPRKQAKKGEQPRRKGKNGKNPRRKTKNGKNQRGKTKNRNKKKVNSGNKHGNKGTGARQNLLARQACDEKELCKRMKLYIKYSNQQRKAKRILNTCKTLKAKSAKAATAFVATADALKDSGDTAVGGIQEKLMNCSKSAAAACDVGNVPQCADAEQAIITECADKLKAWVNAFGPGPASCLGTEKCCECINAIALVVPPECLAFDAVDQMATKMKKSCTQNEGAGGKAGSFGECRKQQMVAAEKGPAAFAKSCGKPGMTTAAVKRMSVLRKALGNKMIYR